MPGIYANLNWWNNHLRSDKLDKYTKWVAQYHTKCQYKKPYDMWQYSSKGKVPGISGRVDVNECYRDFPGELGTVQSAPEAVKPAVSVKKGDTVKLKAGAKQYNGKGLASFVYKRKHKVREVAGDRVVITYGGIVVAAVKAEDLEVV